MAAYTPTVWVNDTPPPFSETYLNKLTNELISQAVATGITHSLPTWTNGAAPAITDATPLNEIERVIQQVATALGLSYTQTSWSAGWTPPRNATRFNKIEAALVANRSAIDAQSEPVPVPTANIPANGIITSGGIYGGDFSGQITISTTSPVTLSGYGGKSLTYTGGTMIRTPSSGLRLTVWGYRITGTSHRIIDADAYNSLVFRNNTIERTSGVTVVGVLGGSLQFLYNKHHNCQRYSGGVGNLVQIRNQQAGTMEVAWNEMINEYNQSDPEDLISIYHSSGVWVHDNYFQGEFNPGNGPLAVNGETCSQNGITLDTYDGGPLGVNNNLIEANQMVRTLSIALFPQYSPCSGNMFLNNRCVNAGYLDDGVTRNYFGQGSSMHVISGGSNNHAHGNVLGAMTGTQSGSRVRGVDGQFEGTPDGQNGEWANNTHLAPIGGEITRAHEDAEWTRWQQKVAAAGVVLGA